jgi:hypothetical protein
VLRERGIGAIVIAGIQTNMCCETTARMGGNLGFDVAFALDATPHLRPARSGRRGRIDADTLRGSPRPTCRTSSLSAHPEELIARS